MNTINCDNCKAEIQMTKDLIETKHLSGGIEIRFFRCKKCNSKYLIDVTDRATREKQIEMTRLRKYQGDLVKASEKFNLRAIENESNDNIDKMDKLQAEIKEAKAELKKKYEGEL